MLSVLPIPVYATFFMAKSYAIQNPFQAEFKPGYSNCRVLVGPGARCSSVGVGSGASAHTLTVMLLTVQQAQKSLPCHQLRCDGHSDQQQIQVGPLCFARLLEKGSSRTSLNVVYRPPR